MPLYQILDAEAPCWVVAKTYDHAIRQWRMVFGDGSDDGVEPEAMLLICGDGDLVIGSRTHEQREKDNGSDDIS